MRIRTTEKWDARQEEYFIRFELIEAPADSVPSRFVSMTLDYSFHEENNPIEVATAIRERNKRYLINTARADEMAFCDFIEANAEKIEDGNWKYEVSRLRKELKEKRERLAFVISCDPRKYRELKKGDQL